MQSNRQHMVSKSDVQPADVRSESTMVSAVPGMRDPAAWAAMLTIGVAGFGLIALPTVMELMAGQSPTTVLSYMLLAMLIATIVMLATGFGIAWFANFWFRETKIPPDQVATVIALIFDCVVGGWLEILFVTHF